MYLMCQLLINAQKEKIKINESKGAGSDGARGCGLDCDEGRASL